MRSTPTTIPFTRHWASVAPELYAEVAPAAAHAQHMPSHIFLAMGMWDDAAPSNEAAWKASSNKQPIESGGYHALWWLQYAAILQQGRFAEARRVLERMETMASAQPPLLLRFHLVQMRVLYSVETGEAYKAGIDISGLDVASRAGRFFRGWIGRTRIGAGVRMPSMLWQRSGP